MKTGKNNNEEEKINFRKLSILITKVKFIIEKNEYSRLGFLLLLLVDIAFFFPLSMGYLIFGFFLIFLILISPASITALILIYFDNYYRNYKKKWIFDKKSNELTIIKHSDKFKREIRISINDIHYFANSLINLSYGGGKELSLITKNKKRYGILSGSDYHTKKVGSKLANFLEKPFIDKNFFKAEILLFSIIIIVFTITSTIPLILNINKNGFLIFIISFSMLVFPFIILLVLSIFQYYKQKKRLKSTYKELFNNI